VYDEVHAAMRNSKEPKPKQWVNSKVSEHDDWELMPSESAAATAS